MFVYNTRCPRLVRNACLQSPHTFAFSSRVTREKSVSLSVLAVYWHHNYLYHVPCAGAASECSLFARRMSNGSSGVPAMPFRKTAYLRAKPSFVANGYGHGRPSQ
jgi:hypothetical protein